MEQNNSFVEQTAEGVITEVIVASNMQVSMNRWVLVEDTEFAFDLYAIKNRIASKSDYSAMLYDVKSESGVPAIYIDFVALNDAPLFPQDTARFICQCLISSKYPGIDVNSFYVESRGITNDYVIVIGTTAKIVFNEEGY